MMRVGSEAVKRRVAELVEAKASEVVELGPSLGPPGPGAGPSRLS